MKIDILSDLHLDFYFRSDKQVSNASIIKTFKDYLTVEAEVLIIAGDISHYNSQITIVERIAQLFEYKKIFLVLGNHDLYLVNSTQRNKYRNSSRNRQDAWYSYVDPKGIVQILDGETIEYRGVKISGCMSWYDGTYNAPIGYDYRDPIEIWKNCMNDARLIKGYKDFYELYKQEKPKITKILEADVIITHVCPLAHHSAFLPEHRDLTSSMFYAFDGEDLLAKTKAKYWVHGHTHGSRELEVYDTTICMNSMGYPGERLDKYAMTIEV